MPPGIIPAAMMHLNDPDALERLKVPPGAVLVCAYACDPARGSEPGGGWEWVVELSMKHRLVVVTRAKNQAKLEQARASLPHAPNLQFLYYDLPRPFLRLKRGWQGVTWYYYLWQMMVGLKLRRAQSKRYFAFAHHVTFGALRSPAGLALTGLPLLLGPVGGGEPLIPRRLWPVLGYKETLFEIWRQVVCWLSLRCDPFVRGTLRRAKRVLLTSQACLENVPAWVQRKSSVFPQFGVTLPERRVQRKAAPVPESLRVLYVSRLSRRKGIGLAVCAFCEHQRRHPQSRLTVVSTPECRDYIQRLVPAGLVKGIDLQTEFLARAQIQALYAAHDVFLYPSLRDSWGRVLLEAMANGLTPLALAVGGPGQIVAEDFGFAIAPTNEREIVQGLAECLDRLAATPELLVRMQQRAFETAKTTYAWEELGKRMETFYAELSPSASSVAAAAGSAAAAR